jgi:MFS family permease
MNQRIWALIVYGALTMFVTGMIGPIMPLFLNSIGFPISQLGLIIAVSGFTSALLSIFAGNLSERFNRNKLFLASGFALTLVPLGYLWASQPASFIALRFLEGVVGPLAGVTSAAIMMDFAKASGRRGAVMGTARSIRSAMFVIGPTVGGIVIALLPIRNIFLFEALLLLAATLVVAYFLKDSPSAEPKDIPIFSMPVLLKDKIVLALLGILLLDFLNFQSLLFVFPLYGERIGLAAPVIGLMITIQSLAYAVLQHPIGKLSDSGKVIPVMAVCALLHGPLIWMMTLIQGEIGLGVLMALVGFASAPVFLAVMLLVSEAAGENTGIAMGMISSIVYLATALGPIFTALLSSLDLRLGFVVPVISSIATIPLLIIVINWYRRMRTVTTASVEPAPQ